MDCISGWEPVGNTVRFVFDSVLTISESRTCLWCVTVNYKEPVSKPSSWGVWANITVCKSITGLSSSFLLRKSVLHRCALDNTCALLLLTSCQEAIYHQLDGTLLWYINLDWCIQRVDTTNQHHLGCICDGSVDCSWIEGSGYCGTWRRRRYNYFNSPRMADVWSSCCWRSISWYPKTSHTRD